MLAYTGLRGNGTKKDQFIVAGDISDYNLGIFDGVYEGVPYKEFQILTKDGD